MMGYTHSISVEGKEFLVLWRQVKTTWSFVNHIATVKS